MVSLMIISRLILLRLLTLQPDIYPSELKLNKAKTSDTEAAFLDLHLSISNNIVSAKVNDKRDDFNFEIVNFPFYDGDNPRSTSYGVYVSQLIRFARASSHVLTSAQAINCYLRNFLIKAISIINFYVFACFLQPCGHPLGKG